MSYRVNYESLFPTSTRLFYQIREAEVITCNHLVHNYI